MVIAPRPPPRGRARGGHSTRNLFWQLLVIAALALAVWWLADTTLEHMRMRGIRSGFDFLADPAGFDIGESWLPYQAGSPYWRAFLVGLGNTLRVSVAGIVLCTVLGTLLGIGRFSANAIVRGLCYGYVEAVRNVPLLLQLLAWYLLLTQYLPSVDDAARFPGIVQLSKNGLSFGHQDAVNFSPEFMAVLLGLTLYTAAFVAEVVRAGIAAVPRGQLEAAASLGLQRSRVLRLVVLPQALRVIVPPLTNQYLNLTKNSSLAVAIGYPELVSVANTSLNQSGRAVECIAIIMAVYLSLSLATAWAMAAFNRRAQLATR
jgi:general L-amino acid transport system permease protein